MITISDEIFIFYFSIINVSNVLLVYFLFKLSNECQLSGYKILIKICPLSAVVGIVVNFSASFLEPSLDRFQSNLIQSTNMSEEDSKLL